jgi:osmotically-inducible protein OsmY
MGNKSSGSNFPRGFREDRPQQKRRYNTSEYYSHNRLGNEQHYDQDGNRFPENQNDTLNTQYDELNTGKVENYNAGGYYGSNYGSINEFNRGRDYEENAGYRDNYNRLTTGQWPEIEEAARRRGMDPKNLYNETPGFHRGKGPKAYQRSDARILEDIHDALTEDPYIDATDIEVTVDKGEVILAGFVEDRSTKRRSEDLVEKLAGVKHLENRLRTRKQNQIVNLRNT